MVTKKSFNASYCARKFLIKMPNTIDLNKLNQNDKGLLWHELTHFYLSIYTFAGIKEFLKYFELGMSFAKEYPEILKTKFSQISQKNNLFPEFYDAYNDLILLERIDYFNKKRHIDKNPPEALVECQLYNPKKNKILPKNQSEVYMKLKILKGSVGVFISSDFFNEAIARAIEDMETKKASTLMPSLEDIPYYAFLKYCQMMFPQDSLHMLRQYTIVLGEACLLSKRPWEAFENLDKKMRNTKERAEIVTLLNSNNSIKIAKVINPCFDDDFKEICGLLKERIEIFSGATQNEAGKYIGDLFTFINEEFFRRIKKETVFPYFCTNNFKSACAMFGQPILSTTKGEFNYYKDQGKLMKGCVHFFALCEIIEKLFLNKDDTRECYFAYTGSLCSCKNKGNTTKKGCRIFKNLDASWKGCFICNTIYSMCPKILTSHNIIRKKRQFKC